MILINTLVVVILLCIVEAVRIKRVLKHNKIVSDIANTRRELMRLVHEGQISADSAIFEVVYSTCEVLMKIRYRKLLHYLPSCTELLNFNKVKRVESKLVKRFNSEMKDISKSDNEEVKRFISSYCYVIYVSLIKNHIWFIVNALGKIGLDAFSKTLRSTLEIEKTVKDHFETVKSYSPHACYA